MYTLVPAAIILGFGAAPLWIAKCAYLTKVLISSRNFNMIYFYWSFLFHRLETNTVKCQIPKLSLTSSDFSEYFSSFSSHRLFGETLSVPGVNT